jgi:hypothetical protein
MKSKVISIDRNRTTEEAQQQPTLAIIRHLPLSKIQPVFSDSSLEELEYFLERAVEQEEYELCKHLKDIIAFRYTTCVA